MSDSLITLNSSFPPLYPIQPGTVGSPFSMSGPITKVVKNDAYTAPRPPVPVAPTRPNPSMAATRSPAAALPVSRTLQQSTAQTSTAAPPAPQVNIHACICSSVYTPTLLLNACIIIQCNFHLRWMPEKPAKCRFVDILANRLIDSFDYL